MIHLSGSDELSGACTAEGNADCAATYAERNDVNSETLGTFFRAARVGGRLVVDWILCEAPVSAPLEV